jgi:hypothetical protein
VFPALSRVPMRARLLSLSMVRATRFVALAALACGETPRGEQGIDFLAEGGLYTVPSNDAGPNDARGPCAENDDAGLCAQAIAKGIPAPHLVVCAQGIDPIDLTCMMLDASAPDARTFCCTTGTL